MLNHDNKTIGRRIFALFAVQSISKLFNTSNFSVVDQGYAYLSVMLNNKADFIFEYNENCDDTLKRDDVDWSQSRVIFISPSFNNYQRESINFKDMPFELWEVKKFENDTVYCYGLILKWEL